MANGNFSAGELVKAWKVGPQKGDGERDSAVVTAFLEQLPGALVCMAKKSELVDSKIQAMKVGLTLGLQLVQIVYESRSAAKKGAKRG